MKFVAFSKQAFDRLFHLILLCNLGCTAKLHLAAVLSVGFFTRLGSVPICLNLENYFFVIPGEVEGFNEIK